MPDPLKELLDDRPADTDRVLRLRALRRALSLTQEEVAERSGLSRIQVNKIENGWDQASKHATFTALARGLGLSAEELDEVLDGMVTPKAMAERVVTR